MTEIVIIALFLGLPLSLVAYDTYTYGGSDMWDKFKLFLQAFPPQMWWYLAGLVSGAVFTNL